MKLGKRQHVIQNCYWRFGSPFLHVELSLEFDGKINWISFFVSIFLGHYHFEMFPLSIHTSPILVGDFFVSFCLSEIYVASEPLSCEHKCIFAPRNIRWTMMSVEEPQFFFCTSIINGSNVIHGSLDVMGMW